MTRHSTHRRLLHWFLAVSVLLHVVAAAALWYCPPCQLPEFAPPRRIQVALQTIPVSPSPAAIPEKPVVAPVPQEPPPPVKPPEPVTPPPPPRPKPKPVPQRPKPSPKPKPQPKIVAPEPVVAPSPEPPAQVQSSVPVAPAVSAPVSQPVGGAAPQVENIAPVQDDWQADYGLQVRQLIEKHKRYPLLARRGGMEGVVELDFTLAHDGRLIDVVVKRSSGYTVLDQAALRAVRSVDTFPPFPVRVTDSELSFKVPLAFRLTRN